MESGKAPAAFERVDGHVDVDRDGVARLPGAIDRETLAGLAGELAAAGLVA